MITQGRSLRKTSGGLKHPYRKKRLYEKGSQPVLTKLGPKRRCRTDRVTGTGRKDRVLQATVANVYNPGTGKHVVAKIKTVSNNPANRHFTRGNIITKGAVIETEAGKAVVTSRPGQHGAINAVMAK
ncbi:TPA: 30S ribosomal protein S8e [Candidatus Woesearchaeota archaeon]|nr:30S ribosomal protein S8e [Candidatus Woesearchaeota archaeon]